MTPRMGRPKSDNPKVKQLGVRFDRQTLEKLDYISKYYNETRAESLRRGVEVIYSEIQK